MCQYPIVLYYIVEAQKRYFCACRLSLHNPAPSQRTTGTCVKWVFASSFIHTACGDFGCALVAMRRFEPLFVTVDGLRVRRNSQPTHSQQVSPDPHVIFRWDLCDLLDLQHDSLHSFAKSRRSETCGRCFWRNLFRPQWTISMIRNLGFLVHLLLR